MRARALPLTLKFEFWSFHSIHLLLCIFSGTSGVELFFFFHAYSFVRPDLYTLAFFIHNVDAVTADVPYLNGSSFIMKA